MGKLFQHLFDAGFAALEPERVAFHHLFRLAQAKDAVAGATVGHIHVNVLARNIAAVGDVQVTRFSGFSRNSI